MFLNKMKHSCVLLRNYFTSCAFAGCKSIEEVTFFMTLSGDMGTSWGTEEAIPLDTPLADLANDVENFPHDARWGRQECEIDFNFGTPLKKCENCLLLEGSSPTII